VRTKNIQSLRLDPPRPVTRVTIDGRKIEAGAAPLTYEKRAGRWMVAAKSANRGLRKIPGLQGPIDDVLLDPFVVVMPGGTTTPDVQRWVDFEIEHFRRRWKNVYRAELPVIRDVDVTPEVCRRFHLVAWGDPASNALIRRVAEQLPISWSDGELAMGGRRFAADRYLPLSIYPNPLCPAKYLVLNSGPTHREDHDRTNSLQNPKLGDWAIVDVTVPPDAAHPGRVVEAGFFDEGWQLPAAAHAGQNIDQLPPIKSAARPIFPPKKLGAAAGGRASIIDGREGHL
jgi:hypothetical protein